MAHQRLGGVLARAIASGAIDASDEQARDAYALAMEEAATDLLLERALLRWSAVLESTAIPYRVLKGAALAHLVYPEPAVRSFGDVDLLVRSAELDAAVVAFTRAGLQRRSPELHPGFDRRFGKGVTFVDSDGWELDLHRTLAPGPFGLRVDDSGLFAAAPEWLTLGGRTLPCLAPTDMFLHACLHAVLGDAEPRWGALRDVVQLAHDRRVEPHEVITRARSWRVDAVVARAVSTAWTLLDVDADLELVRWAQSEQPTRRDEHLLAAYGSGRSYARLAAASLPEIPGWADRIRFAVWHANPRGRTRRPAQHIRRVIRAAAGKPVPR